MSALSVYISSGAIDWQQAITLSQVTFLVSFPRDHLGSISSVTVLTPSTCFMIELSQAMCIARSRATVKTCIGAPERNSTGARTYNRFH